MKSHHPIKTDLRHQITGKSVISALFTPLLFAACFTLPLYAQQTQGTSPGATAIEIESPTIVLRTLDKVTARIKEIELRIGEEYSLGSLTLTARYCRTTPPIEPPETYAYLDIYEIQRDGSAKDVFSGWMLASSPALNSFEHPVYDVWVLNCKASSPDTE
ncbi:hypothetical protein GCM10017044_23030 [Kordiimonas sediminis]|uniref:DUF2155 domain-containing protein n=2 Tax=Kordiimonas sediminis TaxID=1735581 RepID=A0A919AUZ3_9PROT|nr:hypothetical protein GCM10017044_23030 [Kordiimonas sediminis]